MSLIDQSLADFESVLGFEPCAFPEQKHIALAIEEVGELHIERCRDSVLVYLSRPIEVGADRLRLYKSALRAVHFENGLPFRVQCALHQDSMVFLARHDIEDVRCSSLEQSVELLVQLHESLES